MKGGLSPGVVVAVSRSAVHQFSKPVQKSIRLLVGLGVEGDAHLGVTVQHRSRIAKDPTRPNLRQVHLIHEELVWSKYWSEASISSIENLIALITVPVPHRRPG